MKKTTIYEEFSGFVAIYCQEREVFEALVSSENLTKLVRKYEDKEYLKFYVKNKLELTIEISSYQEY